jgi:cell division protein FtsL
VLLLSVIAVFLLLISYLLYKASQRLEVTEEVEKNLTEEQIDTARCLRLASSMLNSTVAKKSEV